MEKIRSYKELRVYKAAMIFNHQDWVIGPEKSEERLIPFR
jgi:hypothetical protein